MELAGRKALLTGATGGLGRAIARGLAERGAVLLLSGRKRDALEALSSELPGLGHSVLPADLAEEGAAERLAAEAGEVDLLVANAGLPGAGPLDDFSAEELKRALRVNLEAPMLMAQLLSPGMVERGSGHLVFIGSANGRAATARTSIYCATKFGLRGFALALRADLHSEGVGVSVVAPGFVREAGMFADTGVKPPAGLGTCTPDQVSAAVVRAVERDKAEIGVAPIVDRALTYLALTSPGVTARVQSTAFSHKTAEAVTSGHSREKR
jgi:short-subunit dehydrogenase